MVESCDDILDLRFEKERERFASNDGNDVMVVAMMVWHVDGDDNMVVAVMVFWL